MILDNFMLEEFSEFNMEHTLVIEELGCKYLGDLKLLLKNIKDDNENGIYGAMYIAYYNDYPVGMISINTGSSGKYYISAGILKKYRGYHLAALLLDEFTEKVFDSHDEINDIYLLIDEKNYPSQNTAKLVGYNQIDNITYVMKKYKK